MKSGIATIVGRPNSGKSTLLNAFVGQKIAIVSDKPQTTRNRILGIMSDPRGQIAFADTPGIHKPGYRMNERMQRAVRNAMNGIDLVLLVVDGSISFGAGEAFALDVVKKSRLDAFLLINKIDKFSKPLLLPIIRRYAQEYEFREIIPISALTGENIPLVTDKIFAYLPEGAPMFASGQYTDRSERFLAGEFIREKILAKTREELPYTCAVLITQFDEGKRKTKKLVHIEADILVEKETQRAIILGAGGARIRDIGIEARRDVEEMLGCRVYLGLRVRTARDWRNNDSILNELEVGT
jgi:GTP-binding protein Era